MTVNKDQAIIIQVAGKIAADLVNKTDDVMANIAAWALAFDAVADGLFTKMDMSAVALTLTEAGIALQNAFGATPVPAQPAIQYAPATGGTVRIKGTQHGPLPEWLAAECSKKGVFEVWDNRDGLAANPKRPWFKSTTADIGFWAPRGR